MQLSAYISIGSNVDFALDKNDNLVVITTKNGVIIDHINLGPCTDARVKEIHEYLDRIASLSSKTNS